MNDPTAQMGFQIGKSAVDAGQQYMEQNVCLAKLTRDQTQTLEPQIHSRLTRDAISDANDFSSSVASSASQH